MNWESPWKEIHCFRIFQGVLLLGYLGFASAAFLWIPTLIQIGLSPFNWRWCPLEIVKWPWHHTRSWWWILVVRPSSNWVSSRCQAIDSKNVKRMQTIQELLTRGLDLDFNALGRPRFWSENWDVGEEQINLHLGCTLWTIPNLWWMHHSKNVEPYIYIYIYTKWKYIPKNWVVYQSNYAKHLWSTHCTSVEHRLKSWPLFRAWASLGLVACRSEQWLRGAPDAMESMVPREAKTSTASLVFDDLLKLGSVF